MVVCQSDLRFRISNLRSDFVRFPISLSSSPTILIHLFRIERILPEDRFDEIDEFPPNLRRKLGIPGWMSHHQSTEYEERSDNSQHLRVSGLREIPVPESLEQCLQVALEPARSLKRKEEIVHRERSNV